LFGGTGKGQKADMAEAVDVASLKLAVHGTCRFESGCRHQ
jgi:hypothetical protein